MTWIVQSYDVSSDQPVGGKALALASAQAAGLPVPDFFVVLPSAFDHSLAMTGAPPAAPRKEVGRVVTTDVMPSEEVVHAIGAALETMCLRGERVAVRSSASDEDDNAHSHAGQLESFLDVSVDDVAARVADVWRSGEGARLLAYRQQRGLSQTLAAPAVIVQRMVCADAAGVAFSADPVSGRR